MAVGTTTIGETPCCGLIERTWEATPASHGRANHTWTDQRGIVQQSNRAPDFADVARLVDRGVCPDCGKRFKPA